MPSALILIADGTEEIEFTVVYDTLVRAGIACKSAYVLAPDNDTRDDLDPPHSAHCSRGMRIVPDTHLSLLTSGPDRYDAIVIPGGATGAATLAASLAVQHLVRAYIKANKHVGMICAGSLAALSSNLPRQRLTSHPSVRDKLEDAFDYVEDPVVVSGTLVTSRGPGTAFPFALTLVELLCGPAVRAHVREPMVFPQGTPF